MDQRLLVDRAKQGDHEAFATLVGATVARLDAAARLILRDPELARDAVQDGLLRAWRRLPGLRDPEKFDAWIRQLVVNSCLDLIRRRRRRATEVELAAIDVMGELDLAAAIVDRDQLDSALRRLDPEWRAIVVMHYFLGMSLPDISHSLGIPLGTAKSRLHRSLGLMRSSIEEATDAAAPVRGGQLA